MEQNIFRWHASSKLTGNDEKWVLPRTANKRIAAYCDQLYDPSSTKPVAIHLADSVEILLAAFGVLCAGRPYCVADQRTVESLPDDAFDLIEQPVKGFGSADPIAICDSRLMCLSGGTSGVPKSVIRSQASWIYSFFKLAELGGTSSADTVAVLGHQAHSLAHYGAMEAIYLGADLHLLDGLGPSAQLRRLHQGGASVVYATPTQLRLLTGRGADTTLPTMRRVMSGGAKLDGQTKSRIQSMFPNARVIEFYGSSETSYVTLTDDATPADSVGKAFPGVTIEIRNNEGRSLPVGEIGHIWVRSPMTFDRYYTGASAATRWAGKFLTIGELGHVDENGCLFVHGRVERMVTIADKNVFLDQVEALISTVPGVSSGACVAIHNALRGHVLGAVIATVHTDHDALLLASRRVLGASITPKKIAWVAELPVLPSGKTDYLQVQQILATK